MWLQADEQKSDENFSSSPNTLLLNLLLSSEFPSSNYTGLTRVHMLRVMADAFDSHGDIRGRNRIAAKMKRCQSSADQLESIHSSADWPSGPTSVFKSATSS